MQGTGGRQGREEGRGEDEGDDGTYGKGSIYCAVELGAGGVGGGVVVYGSGGVVEAFAVDFGDGAVAVGEDMTVVTLSV